jgi:hypothetical protein
MPSSRLQLALDLRAALQPSTIDRKYHTRTYHSCFLNNDALSYLSTIFPSPEQALVAGNDLIRAGYITHVVNEHMFEPSKLLFFRFQDTAILAEMERHQNMIQANLDDTQEMLAAHEARADNLAKAAIAIAAVLFFGTILPIVPSILPIALLLSTYVLFPRPPSYRSSSSSSPSATSTATSYAPQRSSVPPPSSWPHRPILLCNNAPSAPPCPLGVPFDISTPLFQGRMLLRVKGVAGDNPEGNASYFGEGRRRMFQLVVQGQFTKRTPVKDVLTGHIFENGLSNLPPRFLVRAGEAIIARLAPSTRFELGRAVNARVLSVLGATAQTVRVDAWGEEPDMTGEIVERNEGLGGAFKRSRLTAAGRKTVLSAAKANEDYFYEPGKMYTWEFFQDLLDLTTYHLDLKSNLFAKMDLCQYLGGQPVQLLAVGRDGGEFWRFQLWHERLLGARQGGGEETTVRSPAAARSPAMARSPAASPAKSLPLKSPLKSPFKFFQSNDVAESDLREVLHE